MWEPNVPLLDGGDSNWKLNDPPARGEPKDTAIFRSNLYWPTDGKRPAVLSKAHYTWDEWRKLGRDSGTSFADPMFEDLAQRDFRLKPVPLADINAGERCRIAITATTGSGKYDITLTRQSGVKKEFKDIPCKQTWYTANYLLFSSLANRKTTYFIDNVKLEQITKLK